ncbi:MAG: alpha/beta fold hydrolase [Gemmatimonadaceae bacterium]
MSSRDRFAEYRRSLPRPPRLVHQTVHARGLDFAVFTTPPVPGAGSPPLVCINGGLLFDHKLLWPALSPLAERRQLVLYDQRGRGASQAPPGPRAARIEHDAGDVGAIRQALGIDRWDVLGHSWGGGIAMLGAALDPAGTRRLVLVNAVGTTSRSWLDDLHDRALLRLDDPGRAALRAADDAVAIAVAAGTPDDPAPLSAYAAAMYPAWFADRDLATLFTPPRSASRTGAAVSARLRRHRYDWRDTLRGLPVPTLVIHGEEDLLPVDVARETAALLPASRLALLPGSGHLPFWETPEPFFALVEQFLGAPE